MGEGLGVAVEEELGVPVAVGVRPWLGVAVGEALAGQLYCRVSWLPSLIHRAPLPGPLASHARPAGALMLAVAATTPTPVEVCRVTELTPVPVSVAVSPLGKATARTRWLPKSATRTRRPSNSRPQGVLKAAVPTPPAASAKPEVPVPLRVDTYPVARLRARRACPRESAINKTFRAAA